MFFKCQTPGHQHSQFASHNPANEGGGAVEKTRSGQTTVDIHCHVHVLEADEMLKTLAPEDTGRLMVDTNEVTARINKTQQETILPKLTEPEVRIKDMDAQGIDIQAVSPSPFHYNYHYDPEFTRETSKVVNNRIAEVVADHPERFVGMGTVPLQNCELAIAEMERCVNKLGFRGIEISTNVKGNDLTRAGLESFFAKAEELGTLIFMHPIGTSFKERMNDHYFRNTIGHPLESALAVGHLVFDGYLDKFPKLNICIAHGGGYIPAYYGRFDHPFHLRDDCRENITKAPSEFLGQLYFDTVVFTETQLRHMVEVWGADHIVMGTDYPYDMAEPDPVGHVNSVKNLSDSDRDLITGGNALRLLGLNESALN